MNYLRRIYKVIFTLSILSAKEWLHLRFFHIILFFAAFLLFFGYLLSSLTFAVQDRLFYDFAFAGLELCLVALVAAIGSHAIQREIDRRTMYVLLTRPIPKWALVMSVIGSIKILSLIFISFFVLSLLISSWIISLGQQSSIVSILVLTFITYLKALLIASFAVSASLIVRPLLALVLSISYWLLSYSTPDLVFFLKKTQSVYLQKAGVVFDVLIPQFYRMNWKSYEFLVNLPNSDQILWAVFHCLGWILFWAAAASFLFQRKEIG